VERFLGLVVVVLLLGCGLSAWLAARAWATQSDIWGLFLALLSFFMGVTALRLFEDRAEEE
jgi:4-hydroxybenzoate polyprenyltransferase